MTSLEHGASPLSVPTSGAWTRPIHCGLRRCTSVPLAARQCSKDLLFLPGRTDLNGISLALYNHLWGAETGWIRTCLVAQPGIPAFSE